MKIKSIIAVFSAMFLLGLASCQKDGTTQNMPVSSDDQSSTLSLVVPDYNATQSDFSEANTEEPFLLAPPTTDVRGGMDPAMSNMIPFIRILKTLNLTQDQMTQVRTFLKQREDCIKLYMLELRKSEAAIIKAANDARKALLEQAKTESWTREQLRTALERLNARTRNALQTNPARARVMLAIKKCDDTFFANVSSILTEPALSKWNDWVKKYQGMRDRTGQRP